MNDQAEAVEEQDIQARMAALLESEEDAPDDVVDEADEPVEEAEETEETEEPAEEELEITWNGESKVLKKSEVVELAQKGFDYTQKTQALAEQRKAIEMQAQMLQQQAFAQSHLSAKEMEIKALDNQLEQYKQVDWQGLAQSDPMQYLTLNQTFQQLKDAKRDMVQEYQGQYQQLTLAQKQQRDAILAQEAKLMAEAIPELKGEKGASIQTELKSYLSSRGFNGNEIESIMDHRMVKVAYEAAQYAKLKAGQPQVAKKLSDAPKPLKGKPQAPNNQVKELRERAKKGDEKAMIALIERTL